MSSQHLHPATAEQAVGKGSVSPSCQAFGLLFGL